MELHKSICMLFHGSMWFLHFNLIHSISRCMQMSSEYEAGIVAPGIVILVWKRNLLEILIFLYL